MADADLIQWQQVAAAAFAQAGMAADDAQLDSTARTLRRLSPFFIPARFTAPGSEGFPAILEKLVHE
ncbi:MAG: hypothetical protein V4632_02115 [Pseudomonadota bacterium]